jgi:hypothetical protein
MDVVADVRNYISTYLLIDDPKNIQIVQPYEKLWYQHNDKSSKYRLGKLFIANVKDTEDNGRTHKRVAREIDVRVSVFVMEKF